MKPAMAIIATIAIVMVLAAAHRVLFISSTFQVDYNLWLTIQKRWRTNIVPLISVIFAWFAYAY
jgi:hypothetical protein